MYALIHPPPKDVLRDSSPSHHYHAYKSRAYSTVLSPHSPKSASEILSYVREATELDMPNRVNIHKTSLNNSLNSALRATAFKGHQDIVSIILSGWHNLGVKASLDVRDALCDASYNGHT